MRRGPRQLLDLDADARMRALELGQQLDDDFALAAHRPELQYGFAGGGRAARTPPAIRRRRRKRAPPRASARACPGNSSRRGEPAAGEAGALQAGPDVRIGVHHPPDHVAAVILDHREDRPLVDAEVVAIDPAESGNAAAMRQRSVEIEVQVERVEKAVLARRYSYRSACSFRARRGSQVPARTAARPPPPSAPACNRRGCPRPRRRFRAPRSCDTAA